MTKPIQATPEAAAMLGRRKAAVDAELAVLCERFGIDVNASPEQLRAAARALFEDTCDEVARDYGPEMARRMADQMSADRGADIAGKWLEPKRKPRPKMRGTPRP